MRRVRVGLAGVGTVAAVAGVAALLSGGDGSSGARSGLDADRPEVRQALLRGAVQRQQLATPQAKRQRQRSQRAFGNLSAGRALGVGRRVHPTVLRERTPKPLEGARRRGLKVERFASPYAAVLRPKAVKAGRQEGVMAMSTLPLRSRDESRRLRMVNLQPERDGGRFVPDNARVKLSIGATAADGVRINERDIAIVPLDVRATKGVPSADSVFFANSATDSDHIVRVTPAGVDNLVQLRGGSSPERFRYRVDLPAGGQLEEVAGGEFAVRVGGRRVGTITRPNAWDADHQAIPVKTTLQGRVLTLEIAHRGRDIRYPAMLDPNYVDILQYRWYTPGNNNNSTRYWAHRTNRGDLMNGLFTDIGQGKSLITGTRGNQFVPGGTFAYWTFTAPGTTSVAQAEWTRMTHSEIHNGPAPCIDFGLTLASTAWHPSPTARGNQNGQPVCSTFTQVYRVTCWDCNDRDGVNHDPNVKGAQFGTSVYQDSFVNQIDQVGEVTLYVVDPDDPTVTFTTRPPETWTNTPSGTIAATGNDPGLGVQSMTVTNAGTVGNSDCLDAGPCPFSQPRSVSVPSLGLPDGNNTIAVTARDASFFSFRDANGNPVPARHEKTETTQVKLDRGKPTLAPSGTLYDARDGYVGPNRDYVLSVTATDGSPSPLTAQRSGVVSLSATLDGQPMTDGSISQPCTRPESSCDRTINAKLSGEEIEDLDEGTTHTILIRAVDAVGNEQTQSFTFRVDTLKPQIYPSGVLWDLDNDLVADPEVTVNLDATDGDEDFPSSGVDRVQVLVDDTQVAEMPATGCGPANCELSTTWTLATDDFSAGAHTITYKVIDRAGLTETATQRITIRKIEDQPAQSTSAAAAATLRVDGAAGGLLTLGGDRLGSSVANIDDVNGDGIDDFAIGAPGASPALRVAAGAAYIIFGGQSGTIDTASLTPEQGYVVQGALPSDAAGTSVASAGDVDADGTPDLLVGAPGTPVLSTVVPGRAYVLFGGRCLGTVDLGNLGSCGFTITGPTLTLDTLLSNLPGFGENVGGPHAGDDAPPADVNGDGRDDIVLGTPRGAGEAGSNAAGSTFVIYGKSDTAPVNVSSLGASGFRIDGAAAGDQSGTSAAPVGDVNADDFDDIVVGAPGATAIGDGETAPRAGSGKAYVIYGSATPSNIGLANLTSGYPVLGRAGDSIGTTVSGLGDLDSDAIDDFAVGGRGAFIVPGHDNTDAAIDLANPGPQAWRVEAPPGAAADAVVSGAGDLNDDLLSDLVVGYPSLGRAYAVYTQDGLLDKLPQAGSIDGSPGQRTTRYTATDGADGTGAAVDVVDALSDGRSGIVLGAPTSSPNGRVRAGSAFVAPGAQSAQAPTPPDGAITTQTSPPSPGVGRPDTQAGRGFRAEPKCAPVAGWQFFDPPRANEGGGLQPQNFHFYGCVKTTGVNGRRTLKVTTPRNAGCGRNEPEDCVQTRFRAPRPNGFNGNIGLRKRLVDSDAEDMVVVANKDTPAPGTAIPQDPMDSQGREYAWPIRDSFGGLIGYIREVPPYVNKGAGDPRPTVKPKTFRLWNHTKAYMGTADPNTVRLSVEGRPCATSNAAPADHALIFFNNDNATGAIDPEPLRGNFLTVRGLLERQALPAQALSKTAGVTNDKAIDAYWSPCKKPKRLARNSISTYDAPSFLPVANFRYLSDSRARSLGYSNAYEQPGTGTPMLNYTWPQTSDPKFPQYPPHAVLTASPTTVKGGGLTRGVMLSGVSVRYIDGFSYLDPNLVCGVRESWSWSLISKSGIYQYVARRTGDGNDSAVPLPQPLPATYDPARNPPNSESFRPCRSSP